MSIWMLGVDHNRAGLDIRSAFAFTNKKMEEAYTAWKPLTGLEGCVILSTCNRTEVWFSVSHRASFEPSALVCSFLGLDPAAYAPYMVERRDSDAVEHLFLLAAGMDSRIIGEDQIITQVGNALAFARGAYATDHALEVLFRQAVTGAKRVKTESALATADQSVIHAALQALEERGTTVRGKKCMVIGNGMMGRLSAQALLEQGAEVTVTVRRYHSGVVDVPRGCDRIGYEQRLDFLPGCEMVVSATSSPNFTLRREDLAALRVDRPVTLIDLAVPRDIEPSVGELPWATLYDVDSFKIDIRSERLLRSMEKAHEILSEEEERFYDWYECRDFIPQIQRLKTAAGEDAGGRLTPALRRAGLPEETKRQLSLEARGASERMMNHLLHGMRARLSDQTFRECLDAMEQILGPKENIGK